MLGPVHTRSPVTSCERLGHYCQSLQKTMLFICNLLTQEGINIPLIAA